MLLIPWPLEEDEKESLKPLQDIYKDSLESISISFGQKLTTLDNMYLSLCLLQLQFSEKLWDGHGHILSYNTYRSIFSSLVDDSRHITKRERRQNYCQMSYPCIPDNLFISDLILHSTLTSLRNTRQNPSN